MELSATLLPAPVAPAMSRCGIATRSATMGWPAVPFPIETVSGDGERWSSGLARISPRCTRPGRSLGSSTPIAAFPGIGASRRTLLAASASAMSFCRLVIRCTFTPGAGWSSNRVTAGPISHRTTFASTPKLASVRSRLRATSSGASAPFRTLAAASVSSRDRGGSAYPCPGGNFRGSGAASGLLRRDARPGSPGPLPTSSAGDGSRAGHASAARASASPSLRDLPAETSGSRRGAGR